MFVLLFEVFFPSFPLFQQFAQGIPMAGTRLIFFIDNLMNGNTPDEAVVGQD